MDLDPILLSRLQFAFVVSFHILFPSFTIGLASWLAVLEALWLKTGRQDYAELYRFWVKIFALSFGMGVVSGIVMSFQFGTNWSGFSDATGNILGPLLAYEVMTAFFLEATFLGIMLFGWGRVPKGLHFFATLMVAFGTLVSTFWIISANSWMQSPAGYELIDGRFHVTDWWAAIFSPTFPDRLAHMVLASYLTTAFLVGGVGAWYLLRQRFLPHARIMLSMALWLIAVLAPVQIFVGDQHGLGVREHQPAKLAAIEGHWETVRGASFVVAAWPDQEREENLYEIAIPKLGSLILTHSLDGEIQGLTEWPAEDRPPVAIVFWTFRIMVGIGFLMLAVGIAGLVLRWRGRLFVSRRFHQVCVVMAPSGLLAVLTGWFTAEIGRQPWVVYGHLRTEDAMSPLATGSIVASLILFLLAYAAVFSAGITYMAKQIGIGPQPLETEDSDPSPRFDRRPRRPGTAADAAIDPAE